MSINATGKNEFKKKNKKKWTAHLYQMKIQDTALSMCINQRLQSLISLKLLLLLFGFIGLLSERYVYYFYCIFFQTFHIMTNNWITIKSSIRTIPFPFLANRSAKRFFSKNKLSSQCSGDVYSKFINYLISFHFTEVYLMLFYVDLLQQGHWTNCSKYSTNQPTNHVTNQLSN